MSIEHGTETSSDESIGDSGTEMILFDITLSIEEWQLIQPREKFYHEKQGSRKYNVMAPYEWSNVVQDHFFLHTSLPCCLKFKKANIKLNDIVFVSLTGRCSDCSSIFKGTIDSIPAVGIR